MNTNVKTSQSVFLFIYFWPIRFWTAGGRGLLTPFRYAVPVWEQTILIPSELSPNGTAGLKGLNKSRVGLQSVPFWGQRYFLEGRWGFDYMGRRVGSGDMLSTLLSVEF